MLYLMAGQLEAQTVPLKNHEEAAKLVTPTVAPIGIRLAQRAVQNGEERLGDRSMATEWRWVKEETLLVLAAMAGDLSAFDELVRRFRPAVIAVAFQLTGSWDEAEDVAQETFLIALKALPTLRNPQKFGAWLYAITRHQALRQLNHRQRWELDELLIERWEAIAEEDALEQLKRREKYEQLHSALTDLPEMYRLIVWLHYFEDMPLKRIASFLGLPMTTIKWRLHEAKRRLRKRLLE